MRVPPVDPAKPNRFREVLIEPVARTEAGRWWLINVAPKLDPLFYRLSGGRFTSVPLPMLFLTHTGARSGRKSTTPLVYFTDGEDAIVVASNYGRKSHPAWYYNVKANPEVEVKVAGRVYHYRAQVASEEDRERLWESVIQLTRGYADYVERAEGRTIPVIRLSPLDPPGR
jgi:deazaflavin-dependent oxidoreductase (nitroreductase family)